MSTNAVTTAPAGPRGAPGSPRAARLGPSWPRSTLAALLVLTAAGYLWNLAASGYANSFYAGAVWAGTRSWKALLFGSLDPGNIVTVDKPPAAMWLMGLSARLFGFSSWSMLVPEALLGVASVALLYAAVRRWSGPGTALAAAAVLAATPVAALIFRFNNPDALLVFLEVVAAYTTVRAVDAAATRAGTRWLLATGALVGLGFLTKMLQVMLVVPALAGVYLLVADVGVRRQLAQLVGAGVALVVSAGWYVALVALWPAASRPYIGGSTDNSVLQLALGYNGLSRILGSGGGPGGAPPGGPGNGNGPNGFGGQAGLGRMFNADFGGNISWLLPAALLALLAGLWLTRRAPRTDRIRAGLVLWGGWLVVTTAVFSLMNGIIHPYYVVALAPGLAGTLAIGAAQLWARRAHWAARMTLAVGVAVTAAWSTVLLARAPEFLPWLRGAAPAAGAVGALALVAPPARWGRTLTPVAVLAALVATGAGPVAYSVDTVLTPHQGGVVSAGPASSHGRGFGRGPGAQRTGDDTALIALLRSAGTEWSAAMVGGNGAAGVELASRTSVMGIGGFVGGDPAPTLERFQALVAEGEVRYFLEGGFPGGGPGGEHRDRSGSDHRPSGGPMGRSGTGQAISAWVKQHFASTTVDGYTVYNLAAKTR